MADSEKKSTVIQLVAVERGFVNGRMVEPGKTFLFDTEGTNGKPRKLPKWAAKVGDPVLSKPKPQAGDLKPKAAQDAAKAKVGELTDGLV